MNLRDGLYCGVLYGWFYSERRCVYSCSSDERSRRDPGSTEGLPSGFAVQRTLWGSFRLESSILYLPWLWCKIMAFKKFSSENRTRIFMFQEKRSNHYHLSCLTIDMTEQQGSKRTRIPQLIPVNITKWHMAVKKNQKISYYGKYMQPKQNSITECWNLEPDKRDDVRNLPI